jgi:AsnC-like helix-turn-helix protein
MNAYILIETELGQAAIVASKVAQITGVIRADIVTGYFDVIAYVQTEDVDGLSALASEVQVVDGVTRSMVCWRQLCRLSRSPQKRNSITVPSMTRTRWCKRAA